ncbi:MAG: hypothetical protein HY254_18850 [Burkholderiales bacterium]|nr:hypothetical protein [Burkholderiales bacterium]
MVAVFAHHQDAEGAARKLAGGGFDLTQFSIVGQGFHSEEKIVGFYNIGDRIKFWGKTRSLFHRTENFFGNDLANSNGSTTSILETVMTLATVWVQINGRFKMQIDGFFGLKKCGIFELKIAGCFNANIH